MLDCCHPLPKVREEGITLTQAACLARCNGARVELYPYGSVGLEEFRGMVAEACSRCGRDVRQGRRAAGALAWAGGRVRRACRQPLARL